METIGLLLTILGMSAMDSDQRMIPVVMIVTGMLLLAGKRRWINE